MNFCIDADQLRKALSEIEVAEKNGFMYCLSVFRISEAGQMISDNRAVYSDIIERAHQTNPHLDWGRYQRVTKDNRFIDGELVPIKDK